MFLRNLRLDLMDYWVFNTFVSKIEQLIGLMISNNLFGKCGLVIFCKYVLREDQKTNVVTNSFQKQNSQSFYKKIDIQHKVCCKLVSALKAIKVDEDKCTPTMQQIKSEP